MTRPTLLLLLLLAAPLAAQQTPKPTPPSQLSDVFGRFLFPPELIMQRQQEIGLTDAQRDRIRADIQKAQTTAGDVQWQLAGQSEKIARLLAAPQIDEAATLAQADSVLALERQIKRAQLALLVRIHNTLTEPQRARLQQLRGSPQ